MNHKDDAVFPIVIVLLIVLVLGGTGGRSILEFR
jgi:hypothetical protein